MAYELTAKDVEDSLRAEGLPIEEPKESGFMRGVDIFNRAVEGSVKPLMGGVVSGAEHLAANIANVPRMFGVPMPKVEVPEWADPLSYTNQDPISRAMGAGGKFIGEAGGAGKLLGIVNKAAGLTAAAPLYKKAIAGALTGAAVGDEDQPGGRLLSAGIGAAIPSIGGLTRGSIGRKAAQIKQGVENKFENLYDNLLNRAGTVKGAPRVPSIIKQKPDEYKNFLRYSKPEYRGALSRFEQSPTFKSAHEAQSQANKAKRYIEKEIEKLSKRGVEPGADRQRALRTAEDLVRRIRGSMQTHLSSAGKDALADEYASLTTRYAQDMVPFKEAPFYQYEAGDINASKLAKKLMESSAFMEGQGARMIPGLKARAAIDPLVEKTKMLGGLGLAGSILGGGYAALGLPGAGLIRSMLP